MIATLKFELPDEQDEFKVALEGAGWRSAVIEVDQYLRNQLKHEELEENVSVALQNVRDLLCESRAGLDW